MNLHRLIRIHCRMAGLAFLLLLLTSSGSAGEGNAKLEIKTLTLFKNGLGFVVSGAELPGNVSSVRIGQLPIPSFGTFWVGYPKEVKVRSLVTSMEDVERGVPALGMGQLVQANTGRRVLVHTADRDFDGVVLPQASPSGAPLSPDPYFMSPRAADPYGPAVRPFGEILLLKTEKGTVALNAGSILRAEFPDREPVATVPYRTTSPSIRIELEKPAGGENVTVSCLVHGVTWIPSYLVDLTDPKTAKFSAHAEVVNEMADLEGVSLRLVTGFPNIKFGELLSPVAMSQTLADFLRSLSEGGTAGVGARSMLMNQVALTSNSRDAGEASALVPGYAAASQGMVAEDLYIYPVKDFSLKKGETAWIPLFTAEMPYKHIYTWKIGDFLDENDHYRPLQDQGERKGAEEVWHSCRLVNNLSMPLTTASTEFTANGEFTGQDVCSYTAPKTETTIRINKALNVLADQAESEVERKRDASVIHGYHYDLVKIKGELKLRSRIDRPVSVEITKELSGDLLETLPRAGDVKTAKGLRQVNTKHVLTWVVQLEPGEEQNLSYQYQVLFRE
ncbi:MAG TPA: hypothetical protein VMF59_12970 [Bacteroidota bacterium]|nr:hypothetical protein [Bacteroidota bacterium]